MPVPRGGGYAMGAIVMDREPLRAALEHPNVAAFLRVIRQGESSQEYEAYRMMFGGRNWDGSLDEHPRQVFPFGSQHTDAFGAYQIMAAVPGYRFPDTYDRLAKALGPSMEPDEQDLKAVLLISRRKALDDVMAGRLEAALEKCSWEWASLPVPSTGKWRYKGQTGLTLDEAKDIFHRYGGIFAIEPNFGTNVPESGTTPQKETTMPAPLIIPLFSALLPSIVNLIPALASVFKPGSEVAQRNVAAATVVANTLVEATKSPNLQAAVEAMTNDPEARAAATAAVTAPEVWNLLVDAGPGVETARKAAANPDQLPAHKNPAVWFMAAFIPLVYLAAWIVLTGDTFSDDVRMMVLTAIFGGLLASGTAFFLGSSLGSQRKTTMLGGDK